MLAGVLNSKVAALVLIEGLGPFSWEAEEGPHRLRVFLEERAKLESKRLPRYADAQAAADIRRKAGDLLQSSADILVSRGIRPSEGGVTWRSDMRLRLPSAVRFTEAHILAFLKEIACPTLLIRAESGMAFDEKIFDTRASLIRQLEVVKLPGGHHLHLDAPAEVAPVIDRFLRPIVGHLA
jgi:pimeloyl-ACP methyl ester carboxylesterase